VSEVTAAVGPRFSVVHGALGVGERARCELQRAEAQARALVGFERRAQQAARERPEALVDALRRGSILVPERARGAAAQEQPRERAADQEASASTLAIQRHRVEGVGLIGAMVLGIGEVGAHVPGGYYGRSAAGLRRAARPGLLCAHDAAPCVSRMDRDGSPAFGLRARLR
jgi:hypothetical protein